MARFNFEGWQFAEWFKGNSKTLKELIKIGLPLVASVLVVDPAWQQFIITLVGKFVLDSFEYWVKE